MDTLRDLIKRTVDELIIQRRQLGGQIEEQQYRLGGQAHQYQLMRADAKKQKRINFGVIRIRQKNILKHESSYFKIGGHVLTAKFGKPQGHHRPRVSISHIVLETADRSYQLASSRILGRFG